MPDRFHDVFAAALKTGDAGALSNRLSGPDSPGFSVYRNNVVSSIITTLGDAYPAVKRLVGDRFFANMAKAYWEDHPPTTRSLTLYGERFADHVAAWKPAENLTYLADIARLDRAWLHAHHAEDAPALTVKSVQAMAPEALGAYRPGLHPSARVITSDQPVYTIWRTNREDETVEKIRLDTARETALVHRPKGDVKHRTLTPVEALFLDAIAKGASFDGASGVVANSFPGADPAPVFISLLTEGVFRGTEK